MYSTVFTKFITVLVLLFTVVGHSQEIVLIQAPGASPADFNEFVKNNKNFQTILSMQIRKEQVNPLQEEKFFSLGEQLGRPAGELIQEIETYHKTAPLTQVSLSFLTDFSEKLITTSLSKTDFGYLKSLSCQSQLLIDEAASVQCKTAKVDLEAIRRQWPKAQTFLIESKVLDLDEQNFSPVIVLERSYHWTLLSNSTKRLSFFGTYEQFMQQNLVMENFVDGTCEGFSTSFDDFQLTQNGLIFFSKECHKHPKLPAQQSQIGHWLTNNKKWVYPLSGILIGGAIFSAQGKTLVINKP